MFKVYDKQDNLIASFENFDKADLFCLNESKYRDIYLDCPDKFLEYPKLEHSCSNKTYNDFLVYSFKGDKKNVN